MTSNNYEISETQNQFTITIKRESNFLILFVTGLWLIAWIVAMGAIFYGIIGNPSKLDANFALFLAFFVLAGPLVFKTFLWHLRGKERITLENKQLQIKKIGTILTGSKNYEIDYIDNISKTHKPTIPWWIRFWGYAGGKIEFDYLEQKKYFGQTLTTSEATQIIEKLKEKLSGMKNKSGQQNEY